MGAVLKEPGTPATAQQLQQQQQQLQQQQQQQPVQQPLIGPMTESETMRGGVRVPSLVSEWSSNPPAGVPPVGAPNGDVLTQMLLISQMTPQQAQMAATVLNEQLGSQARGVPERFGQLPTYVDARPSQFVAGASTGVNAGRFEGTGTLVDTRDVFSRADKWLGQPPPSGAEKWQTREQEIAGFSDYVAALQSWAALASLTFAEEISVAARWREVLWQHSLTEEQKVRSVRLFGILKAAFNDHPRASLMIQAFSEGLPLDNSVVDTVRFMGNVTCGFELLRKLSQQFSLRSRAEALLMRSELLGRIFALKHSEMTSATVVGDVIRKIDIEVARFLSC